MVVALLDTSVVVDLLRNYDVAEMWLNTQARLGVAQIVWIEVLEGAFNKSEQRRAIRVFQQFDLIEVMTDDIIWATEALTEYGWSHNVDGFDCIIAAVSNRLQLPLYTHNLKHFTPMIGALAVRPY